MNITFEISEKPWTNPEISREDIQKIAVEIRKSEVIVKTNDRWRKRCCVTQKNENIDRNNFQLDVQYVLVELYSTYIRGIKSVKYQIPNRIKQNSNYFFLHFHLLRWDDNYSAYCLSLSLVLMLISNVQIDVDTIIILFFQENNRR